MTGVSHCHEKSSSVYLSNLHSIDNQTLKSSLKGQIHKDSIQNSTQESEIPSTELGKTIELTPPNPQPNYLATLSDAFAKIYTTMSNTVIAQVNDQSALQNLDQTMSNIVIDSIGNSMKKEIDLTNKEDEEAQKEQQEDANTEKWQKISMILGIVLFVVMIGVGIATGGAGDVALAPIEMAEMSASAAPEMEMTGSVAESSLGDAASSDDFDIDPDADEGNSVPMQNMKSTINENIDGPEPDVEEQQESEESDDYMQNTRNMMKETQNNNYETESPENDLENNDAENESSKAKLKRIMLKLAKATISLGAGSVNAMPFIFQAKTNFITEKYKNEIAALIETMGPVMGQLQQNTAYFTFYQQLVQRGSQYVQQLSEESSQSVEIFGGITNAYSQIAISLARAA